MRQLLIMALVLTGVGIAVQGAMNAQMGKAVEAPTLGALVSFIIGGAALALITLSGVFGRGHPSGALAAPWWAWCGGLMGACYVTLAVIGVPRLGAAIVFTTVVFGQVIGALLIDQFGLLSLRRIELSPTRLLGAILVLVGAYLVQKRR